MLVSIRYSRSAKSQPIGGAGLFFFSDARALFSNDGDPARLQAPAEDQRQLTPLRRALQYKSVGLGHLIREHAFGQDIASDEGMPMHSSLECA